ncbi:HK97 gp10 family phage protein [bacterium]|nr:HK97 gp10 family phage protein [bacterium]
MRSGDDKGFRLKGVEELFDKFEQAPEVLAAHVVKALGSGGLTAEAFIKRETPTKTRNLRGSIALQTTPLQAAKGLKVQVGTPVIYGEVVEYGSKPHEIRAKNAPYLTFQINGNWTRVESVNHPGSEGAFMFRDGLEAARPRIYGFFQKAVDDARKELGL